MNIMQIQRPFALSDNERSTIKKSRKSVHVHISNKGQSFRDAYSRSPGTASIRRRRSMVNYSEPNDGSAPNQLKTDTQLDEEEEGSQQVLDHNNSKPQFLTPTLHIQFENFERFSQALQSQLDQEIGVQELKITEHSRTEINPSRTVYKGVKAQQVISTNIAEPTPRYAESNPDTTRSRFSGFGVLKNDAVETQDNQLLLDLEASEDLRQSQINLTPIGYFTHLTSTDIAKKPDIANISIAVRQPQIGSSSTQFTHEKFKQLRCFSKSFMQKFKESSRQIPFISDLSKEMDLTAQQFTKLAQFYSTQPRIILRHASGTNQILHIDADGTTKDQQSLQQMITSSIKVSGSKIPDLVLRTQHVPRTPSQHSPQQVKEPQIPEKKYRARTPIGEVVQQTLTVSDSQKSNVQGAQEVQSSARLHEQKLWIQIPSKLRFQDDRQSSTQNSSPQFIRSSKLNPSSHFQLKKMSQTNSRQKYDDQLQTGNTTFKIQSSATPAVQLTPAQSSIVTSPQVEIIKRQFQKQEQQKKEYIISKLPVSIQHATQLTKKNRKFYQSSMQEGTLPFETSQFSELQESRDSFIRRAINTRNQNDLYTQLDKNQVKSTQNFTKRSHFIESQLNSTPNFKQAVLPQVSQRFRATNLLSRSIKRGHAGVGKSEYEQLSNGLIMY